MRNDKTFRDGSGVKITRRRQIDSYKNNKNVHYEIKCKQLDKIRFTVLLNMSREIFGGTKLI